MSSPITPEADATLPLSSREKIKAWKAIVAKYQVPHRGRAWWQIINSIGAYMAIWEAMYFTVDISWWLTIPLAVLAGGLLVRVFIIFHDCGHGSFFKSPWANTITGYICGVLTFTPYRYWRWQHSIHHSTSGDLDRRGMGDIWTLTVQEYLEASRWKRFAYRLARNPFILFGLAPLYLFLFHQRFSTSQASRSQRYSVWIMNASLLAVALALGSLFGWGTYLILQLTVLMVSGSAGIWLFYVQHQFEDVYWEHSEEWDYTDAALQGSSFYKLPKVLQWFSGNIGFHHIHHLSPRIPNYHLERCHRSHAMFKEVEPLTLLSSLKSLTFRLWDESSQKLVSFRTLRTLRKEMEAADASPAR